MGQFVQTNGDYTIKTAEGGNIFLDTGEGIGAVRISGNLLIQGNDILITSQQLNIIDNIITLNYYEGDPGSIPEGVLLRYSGIQIDRGTLVPMNFLWDDFEETWFLSEGLAPGPFNFSSSKLKLKEILTSSSIDNGDLTLIGNSSIDGIVKITGNNNYTQNVINRNDPDVIPNKGYVDFAIAEELGSLLVTDDTRIISTDKDIPGSLTDFEEITGNNYSTFGESAVSILVDGLLNTQFYTNRVEMFDLEFSGSIITSKSGITNENIVIRTQGTGKLETNYAIQLENIASTPANINDSTVLYSKSPDIGDTGLWFANQSTDGEFVSKNRALVFSMIF